MGLPDGIFCYGLGHMGCFGDSIDYLSLDDFVVRICRGDHDTLQMIQMKKVKQLVKRCLSQGPDGCMIGNDLAFNGVHFFRQKN